MDVSTSAGVTAGGRRRESGCPAPVRAGTWALRPAESADVERIAELRATVMRPDLERLGRFDERRVRQRLRDSFSARYTSVVVVGNTFAGCVTLRPGEDEDEHEDEGGRWLEHFYLASPFQGRGLGSAVLRTLLDRTDAEGATVRLNVLRGSAAQRLYQRHGFTVETQDPVDVFMVRPPTDPEEPHE
ncbi:GNAT family N-acetyltransferase [Streptomyces sp. NPDC060223]|uniref:GNAT family N-acetyltransferase n=1 Tax=unclassified Streptomyces TaxID=2593676 RepID=UPI00363F27BF